MILEDCQSAMAVETESVYITCTNALLLFTQTAHNCGSAQSQRQSNKMVFTARRVCIARTMPLQDVSVHPSLCPSHVGILSKRLYISLTGASNARRSEKSQFLDEYLAFSRK